MVSEFGTRSSPFLLHALRSRLTSATSAIALTPESKNSGHRSDPLTPDMVFGTKSARDTIGKCPDVAPERLRGRYNQESEETRPATARRRIRCRIRRQRTGCVSDEPVASLRRTRGKVLSRSNGDVAVQTNSDLNVVAVPFTGCRVTAGARMQALPNTTKAMTNRVPPVNGQRRLHSSTEARFPREVARCLGSGFQQH